MGSLYVGTQLVCPVAGNSSAVTEALNVTPSTSAQTIYPTSGLDGYAPVNVSAVTSSIDNNITAGNIKHGVSILGVTGTYTGEGVTAQSKTVTPYTTQQVVIPDSGYDYLSQVTVEAISFVETDNAAGGKTVTIGTVAV